MDKKCNHCRLNFSRKLSLTPTRLTFFRGARGNLYPKKKRDPILLLSRFQRFLLVVDKTMNIPRRRRENSRLRIVVCRYRLSSLHGGIGFEKSFFQRDERNIGAKRGKRAADFRCVWERRRPARRKGRKKAREIIMKRARN